MWNRPESLFIKSLLRSVQIARFPHPLQNTARVILAITDSELTRLGFQETVDIAKSLAEELKATLQVVLVATKREKSNKSAAEVEIISEIPVNRVRGNFIKLVSQQLLEHDLLILTTISQQQKLWNRELSKNRKRSPGLTQIFRCLLFIFLYLEEYFNRRGCYESAFICG